MPLRSSKADAARGAVQFTARRVVVKRGSEPGRRSKEAVDQHCLSGGASADVVWKPNSERREWQGESTS